MTATGAPPRLAATPLQRYLWQLDRDGGRVASAVRGLRLTGTVDTDRLVAAIGEVSAAFEVLRRNGAEPSLARAQAAGGSQPDRDADCVARLHADRARPVDLGRDPLVRFHLVHSGPDQAVLALAGHPLAVDVRSIYLLLGAVMQAYFGRFRTDQYPSFGAVAGLDPVGAESIRRSRAAWWSARLERWYRATGAAARSTESHPTRTDPAGPEPAADPVTVELPLPAERWDRVSAGGQAGNAASLAAIALVAWWLRTRSREPSRPPVFGSTLDLRDYLGLGPVVGPLTDGVPFEIDLTGFDRMTFRDLVRRAHAGLLDAVVHYLPYPDLIALGIRGGALTPPRVAALWDIGVNYCRLPPASAYTRGEQTLARRGLSIELFREAALARADQAVPDAGRAGVRMDLHVAESGADTALVVTFDPTHFDRDDVRRMLYDIDGVIDLVSADPDRAVTTLAEEDR